jgi:hypothetical protein
MWPQCPKPAGREVLTAEQSRLPLAYYQEQVLAPAGWDSPKPPSWLFPAEGGQSASYQDHRDDGRGGMSVSGSEGISNHSGLGHAVCDT